MKDVGAIIFDMDDTLVETAGLWTAGEAALLGLTGHVRTAELSASYKGMNALDVAARIHAYARPEGASVREYQEKLRGFLIEGMRRGVRERPGAVALVRRLAGRYPLAVASGSPMGAIEAALGQLGILAPMKVVVSSEEVKRGKPSPDVFLLAAERLGVESGRCLVFEDSLIGTQAAVAAGMRVYVTPSGEMTEAWRGMATGVYADLTEVGEV